MIKIEPAAVYIQETGSCRRRGIFAAKPFRSGEIIENCPLVLFENGVDLPAELNHLLCNWDVLQREIVGFRAIVLGYGSMYFHHDKPNMRFETDVANKILRLVALHDIDAHEELTINYTNISTVHKIKPAAVYIQDTGTLKGRGVFAAKPFAAGEMVDTAFAIPFNDTSDLPDGIHQIKFSWDTLASGVSGYQAITLGYGSMYNHDNPANLRYEADVKHQAIRFFAVRDIRADEELTINYNAFRGSAVSDDNNWFERMSVVPIADDQDQK